MSSYKENEVKTLKGKTNPVTLIAFQGATAVFRHTEPPMSFELQWLDTVFHKHFTNIGFNSQRQQC